jgi:ABC-type transport system involved in multi-copper enzyme maturation permease subunit
VLPNLAQFDVKADVVHGVHVPLGYMAVTTGYAAAYIAVLLVIAALVFSRRDFK